MLRVSAQTTQTEIDLLGLQGDRDRAAVGITFGTELMEFAESVARRDPAEIARAREQLLRAAGDSVLVDAAGVAANFQRMVRIADATGIPVDDMTTELGQQVRAELQLERFPGAQHSHN